MKRVVAGLACCVCVLAGCTQPADDPSAPSASAPQESATATTPKGDRTPSTPSEDPEPPHPVSLPALMEKEYDGARLRLGAEVHRTATQRQYEVTYRGDGLTLSGRIAVPEGDGPFPAVVLAHGYIDPAVYVNGQGMTREREWFADQGYVALHVDYRNHAGSDDTRLGEADLRMGYAVDVVNAVLALRSWDGPVDDDRVAVAGRSMGGGVVYNVLVAQPGLVDAGVVWAPVSSDAVDSYERWIAHDPGRQDVVRMIDRLYGLPRDNPEVWEGLSARTYFDRITEPVLIHHGTADDTCPPRWSQQTLAAFKAAGADARLVWYDGEQHAFGPQWPLSMRRTVAFFKEHLRA